MLIGKRARSLAKQVLTEQQNRRYERRLRDRQVSYDAWVREQESRQDKEREEDVANSDIPRLVYVIASEGKLSDRAFKVCGRYFAEHPECRLAYGDEDVRHPGGERTDPWFKPDWSPDLLESWLYLGSVLVFRKELWERMLQFFRDNKVEQKVPGQRLVTLWENDNTTGYSVSSEIDSWEAYQKWLLYGSVVLAASEGYQKRIAGYHRDRIGHIPEILFHAVHRVEQKKFQKPTISMEERWGYYIRDFQDAYMGELEESCPVVSVIIPSKDHPDILEKCLKGCKNARTDRLACEVLIVDNGSGKDNRHKVEELAGRLAEPKFRIHYLYQNMEFHFSRMCNLGAAQAKGKFLLFLNDDVELCLSDTILKMAAIADVWDTGAVGLKLYYPNSDRIQHAGITNLPMGPVHKLQFLEDSECYYYGANRGLRNVLAVTAACLMVEKEKFDKAGGFAEELPVAFNDVDLCFTLYEQGYYNVCIEDGYAYHHESLSRGNDESAEKLKRLLKERDVLYGRHPVLRDVDPYYPKGLGREGLDTRIRPAYETAGNRLQSVAGKLSTQDLIGYRRDDCLLLRVEQSREGVVLGYGVVLGDNNACYDFALLLVRHGEELSDPDAYPDSCEKALAISLMGQYRPDLVENMSDQVNVGLCGFWVKVSAENTEPGRYWIGMTAKNRVTGLRLVNFGNRWVDVFSDT
ncbi:MAG: glycosyltransferase [Acetatifactor sp.]|nr:glycosyltransferase [Acetatifactor sp.]